METLAVQLCGDGWYVTVTTRTQVLLVPQHWSMASQVWLIVWLQPLVLIVLPIKVTVTLLQQASTQAGGLVGIGLPQVMVRLLHRSVGTDGTTVTSRTQVLLVPQHWSRANQVW